MESVTELTIAMPNVPSSLAMVGDRLRSAGINISAISCTEGHPKTLIHLILDDTDTAKIVLRELGEVTTAEVVACRVKNKPGSIAQIGRDFAAAGINIRYIYSTTCGRDGEAMLYAAVDDTAKAIEMLNKWQKSR